MDTALESSLTRLRASLTDLRLPLPLPGAQENQRAAAEITAQLDDYVLPRLATIDAPLLCVVGGSTGAGKSTLVNSLVGRVVTKPGVIRPTTRAPVLVHHPADTGWFDETSGVDGGGQLRILPGMARTSGAGDGSRALQLVADDSLPPGLAILDAPDIDSVVEQNRQLASQLLAAADLWLFVTSAARYADAVPWDFLHSAAARSAAVAVVCDRVPPSAMRDVPPHLGTMMAERGLGSSPLFAVPETMVDDQGLLPASAVQPIRSWLASLAHDKGSRDEVVHRTLDGAIGSVVRRVPEVAQAISEQAETLAQLRSDVDRAWAEGVRAIGVQTADGTLLRGEVLARWHDFVGTGEFFRALEQKIGWLRDRIVATFRGEPPGAGNLKVAVESGMEALIREQGEAAAERSDAAWQANPAGRFVLRHSKDDLGHPSHEFAVEAARMIRDWQGDLLDLVAVEGMSRRSQARFLALGVNGVGVALMILVFSQTGGLVGAEIGVAGGTAVLAQRVLEAVFGDQAVRRLAEMAKHELDARVESLLAEELHRYYTVLAEYAPDPEAAARLLKVILDVMNARAGGLPQSSRPAGVRAVAAADVLPALTTGSGAPVLTAADLAADDAEIIEAELVEEIPPTAHRLDHGPGDSGRGDHGPGDPGRGDHGPGDSGRDDHGPGDSGRDDHGQGPR